MLTHADECRGKQGTGGCHFSFPCLMRPNLICSLRDDSVAILTQTRSVIKSHWSLVVSPLVFISFPLWEVKGEAAFKGNLGLSSATPCPGLSLVFLQESNDDGQSCTMGCGLQRWKSREVLRLVPGRAPIYHMNRSSNVWRNRKSSAVMSSNYPSSELRGNTLKWSQENSLDYTTCLSCNMQ